MRKETEEENIDWESIKAAIVGGESFREVAKRFGLKVSRVSMRSTRGNWKREVKEEDKQLALGEETAREIELELDSVAAELRRSSIKTKSAIAEEVGRIMRELKEVGSEMGLASRARILAAVTSISERLHRWREEPVPEDPRVMGAINLRLIRTSPQELKRLALMKKAGGAKEGAGRVVEEEGQG